MGNCIVYRELDTVTLSTISNVAPFCLCFGLLLAIYFIEIDLCSSVFGLQQMRTVMSVLYCAVKCYGLMCSCLLSQYYFGCSCTRQSKIDLFQLYNKKRISTKKLCWYRTSTLHSSTQPIHALCVMCWLQLTARCCPHISPPSFPSHSFSPLQSHVPTLHL